MDFTRLSPEQFDYARDSYLFRARFASTQEIPIIEETMHFDNEDFQIMWMLYPGISDPQEFIEQMEWITDTYPSFQAWRQNGPVGTPSFIKAVNYAYGVRMHHG
jgi:hypothetical protein